MQPAILSSPFRDDGPRERPFSSASRSSARSSSTYKRKLAQDLRFEAAGQLEYVMPRPAGDAAATEAVRSARRVLRHSDIGVSMDAVTLAGRDASPVRPVQLGSARQLLGGDAMASVRAPHAALRELVMPSDPGGAMPAASTSRGHRVDLKHSARSQHLAGAAHERASASGRGFARG